MSHAPDTNTNPRRKETTQHRAPAIHSRTWRRHGNFRRSAGLASFMTTLAVAALTMGGCSKTDVEPGKPAPTLSSTSPPSDGSQPPSNPTTLAIDKLSGGKDVELTTETLPQPPPGFSAAEVAAFAERAIDLVERGISPEVATKTSAEAFDYVFANQYRESAKATQAAFEAIGDYDYSWAVASRFNEVPTKPSKVLAARWQVSTSTGQTAAGVTAPRLLVVLSVAVEHQVPAVEPKPGEPVDAPIVIQRTYLIEGFEPLGGRTWWPGIGVQTNPYFGGKCAPKNGGILTPATRPSIIREDLKNLREYLNKPKTVTGATSKASDLAEYLKKYCENP